MAGRLDQPLDAIIGENKKAKRMARPRKGKPAPVGGVKKAVKPAKPAVRVTTGPAPRAPRNSKIIVSSLPRDVTETQIKEYFGKSVGPIKKVSLSYDAHGNSKGTADITFIKPDAAAKAAKEQNGLKIDGRPMKVEVVVDASHAPEPTPAKSLAERVAYENPRSRKSAPLTQISANPKAQPKSAVSTKANPKDKKNAGKARPKKVKTARPKKTMEELDADMVDYFGSNSAAAATTDAAAPVAGAADAMEEAEI